MQERNSLKSDLKILFLIKCGILFFVRQCLSYNLYKIVRLLISQLSQNNVGWYWKLRESLITLSAMNGVSHLCVKNAIPKLFIKHLVPFHFINNLLQNREYILWMRECGQGIKVLKNLLSAQRRITRVAKPWGHVGSITQNHP